MQKTFRKRRPWFHCASLLLSSSIAAQSALAAETDPDLLRRAMDRACEQFACQAAYAISFKNPSIDSEAQELTVSFSMRRNKGLHYPTRSTDHDAQLDQKLYAASCRLRNLDSASLEILDASLSPLLRQRLQGCIRALAKRIDRAIDPEPLQPAE